ncbi:MAG: ATP-grasp domain-containing protein [Candidatus Atribacteria bacterium]
MLDIPVPKTIYLGLKKDLKNINIKLPIVVKRNLEAGESLVRYVNNKIDLEYAIDKFLNDESQDNMFPIIQEYIYGIGVGFFGFYQNGKLKRFYIHKRLREYPVSGGPSTAAKTFYHPRVFEYGKRILDKLNWNGIAMVEFKYNQKLDKLWLMEVNPKFWGSTELGLASGINFGELLIRSFMGENIDENLSIDYYKRINFYWPLDGDLLHIFESKKYTILLDYLKFDYKSNFYTNGILLDIYKFITFLKKLLLR